MTSLDQSSIKRLDSRNVLGSIRALPKQCADAFTQASKVSVPKSHVNPELVVFSGMGGSGLGARVIETVFASQLKVPVVRVTDYTLPAYANKRTLVFCSSYSGTTEETLATVAQAKKRKCQWLAIASGGTLIEQAKKSKVPFYHINPMHNPSNQPRMAVGYSIMGQLVLASKAKLLSVTQKDVTSATSAMLAVQKVCETTVAEAKNPALQLATAAHGKMICFVSAEHLVGAVHTMNNQFNENAKNLTFDFTLPELNHHLMEGLKHPVQNKDNVLFVFVDSTLYSKRERQRLALTEDVVRKNGLSSFTYLVRGQSRLDEALALIQFGMYANFYLALLYNQDPAPIPWVDYFKIQLGQPLGK